MLYETTLKIKDKISVINTLKVKDAEKGWNTIMELPLAMLDRGTILDINIEFQAQNESARLRDKSVRVVSRIIGDYEYKEFEILEKSGQNITPNAHYWLCSRVKKHLLERNYAVLTLMLQVKAAMQGALKTDYIELGESCRMQVEYG